MIIVSQDKNLIANLSNICFLGVEECYECFNIEAINFNCNTIKLAKYKTKERAKEVLQEIIKAYENNQKVYEMPKE